MKRKLKTKLALIICGIICFGLFGCNGEENGGTDADSTVEESVDGDSEEVSEDAGEESSDEAGVADDEQYKNAESPAPIGEWIKSAAFNPVSGEQEVIYWRVTGVNSDAQASVEAYNNGGNFWVLEQPEEDFIKYYEMEYEIRYPEEYSQEDFGITVSDLSLSAENRDGRGFEKDGTMYLGVGSCTDVTKDTIGEGEENPRPGDTVKRKIVFTMIDGCDDYVFAYSYTDTDGERKTSYAASR